MSDFLQQVEARIKVLEAELADLKRIKERWGTGTNSASQAAEKVIMDGNVTAFIHALIKTELIISKDEIKKRVRAIDKFKDYDGRQIHFAILNLKNRGKVDEKKKDEWRFLSD